MWCIWTNLVLCGLVRDVHILIVLVWIMPCIVDVVKILVVISIHPEITHKMIHLYWWNIQWHIVHWTMSNYIRMPKTLFIWWRTNTEAKISLSIPLLWVIIHSQQTVKYMKHQEHIGIDDDNSKNKPTNAAMNYHVTDDVIQEEKEEKNTQSTWKKSIQRKSIQPPCKRGWLPYKE